jgi:hypothetical protein
LTGVLAVLRRVADVVCGAAAELAEPRSRASTVDRTSSRDSVVWLMTRPAPVRVERAASRGLDDDRRVRALALRPDHLDVVGMADERTRWPLSA